MKPSVEGICLKIYNLSAEYARKVREKSNCILKDHGLELPPALPNNSSRKVWCYPIQFQIGCLRLPTIEYLPDRDQALLRFQGDTLAINATHLQKLVRIQKHNCQLIRFIIIIILGTFI